MSQRMSKVVPLVLCALIALPASAGERHSHHRGVMHWANNANWAHSPKPWFGDRGRRHDHNRYVRLKHFSPYSNGYRVRTIIAASPQLFDYRLGYPSGGVYTGSYGYETQGDTYFGADGYALNGAPQAEPLAPKAKVINVAAQADPCSYEANVCVIRP